MTTPKRYRKKPVVIEAIRWDGTKETAEALTKFMGHVALHNIAGRPGLENYRIEVATPGGVVSAFPGDWIIKGVKGEFYPCKPDIFEATYEEGPL